MNEMMPKPKTPEELIREDEEAQYAAWMKDHPETVVAPDARRDAEAEIAEFEDHIVAFEAENSLEELHAIMTEAEARNHPVRKRAAAALGPIVKMLNTLEGKTNITSKKYDELKAKYKRLSQAVGMINSGKVDHTR